MGENKCLDQGTVLVHGGKDEVGRNIPFHSLLLLGLQGENKCVDQGTVLVHGGEDEAGGNILFLAPVGSPGRE